MPRSQGGLVSNLIVWWISVLGLMAFLYPFFFPMFLGENSSHAADAPLIFGIVALGVVVSLLSEVLNSSYGDSPSKEVALLGSLAALNAALRLLPSIMGASPMFFLVIVVGWVFGARRGFLFGALSMLLSALLTGGVGPWLPYQMLGMGWVGLGAGLLPGRPHWSFWMLVLYGFAAGYAYGVLLNLWFWPFVSPASPEEVGLYWSPGMSAKDTLLHYASFYMATSVVYDTFRALGNVVALSVLGGSVSRLLLRYRARLNWAPTGL